MRDRKKYGVAVVPYHKKAKKCVQEPKRNVKKRRRQSAGEKGARKRSIGDLSELSDEQFLLDSKRKYKLGAKMQKAERERKRE
eukprot:1157179-Pelagomonas_calceolata.AAC.21